MKIAVAADTYYPNIDGASYFTQRLVDGLVKRGHEVLVISPGRTKKNVYTSHHGAVTFEVASWPSGFHAEYRFCPPIFLKNKIRPALQKFRPDVVHIQGHFFIEAAAASVAKEMCVPVVGTSHFMPENLLHYAFFLTSGLKAQLKKLMWLHFKSVFKALPVITTPTHTAAKILKDIGIKQNVEALSCGIDMRIFNSANDGGYLKKKYALPDGPIVLCVNRLAPEKNVDLILRAVALALKQTPFHFVVAGDGKEKNNLQQLAQSLGISKHVTFTAYISDADLPNLYPLASVFVMAGTVELQSLVTMEAMASGLPIIAADALALPELVQKEENGLLFKPGDAQDLANYIQKLCANETVRKSMAQKSLAIIKKHDIETTIKRFEEMYAALVKKIVFYNAN